METIKLNGNAKMIAHRGLSGLETESTIPAFVAAGNRSYFGIEADLHRTRDRKLVMIHDDDTERVSGGDFYSVELCTYNVLRGVQLVDINSGEPRSDLYIPTLEEYAAVCAQYDKTPICELKVPISCLLMKDVLGVFERVGNLERTIFISFIPENLQRVRRRLPNQKVQLLTRRWDESVLSIMKTHNFDVDLHYTAVTRDIVSQLHDSGFEVNCWTVNTLEDGEAMLEAGVDYITSNILE